MNCDQKIWLEMFWYSPWSWILTQQQSMMIKWLFKFFSINNHNTHVVSSQIMLNHTFLKNVMKVHAKVKENKCNYCSYVCL